MVLLACIADLKKIRVSDYPFGFGYPRVSVLGLNLYPNWSSGRVRVLGSDFGFRCPNNRPEPNPTRCHPYILVVQCSTKQIFFLPILVIP